MQKSIFYRSILPSIIIFLNLSCAEKSETLTDPIGIWRAEIHMQNDTLPLNFEILKDDDALYIEFINGDERIKADLDLNDDSIHIPMHIFDTYVDARIEGDEISGVFVKPYAEDYVLGFYAKKNLNYRFSPETSTELDLSGKWAVMFESALEDSVWAIGEFKQEGSSLLGTFLTETGDYRFLEGEVDNEQLKLSTFDGEHAFLFTADYRNDSLIGTFKSGKSWNEGWIAVRNDSIELTDPYELTYLNEGYDQLEFSFRNLNGDTLHFPEDIEEGKAVIVQIFGTWCPNCMDETIYLSDWYEKNKDRGIEIIALDYERKDDFEYAKARINKMKDRLGVDYTFLFAGKSDKAYASESLPALNKIISFPTLIILDRSHNIVKIHTGFSGPGTGKYYDKFTEEFEELMESILNQ